MKRILSCFVITCLIINVCGFSVYASELGTTENDGYVRYDLEHGTSSYHLFSDLSDSIGNADYASSPGYFPNGTVDMDSNMVSPAAIVGSTDSRVPVSITTVGPYCNTVYIYSHFTHNGGSYYGIGSGFVIGPSAVGTAAHCVYNSEFGLADYIEIVPAKNGTLEPYGQETISSPVIGDNVVISAEYLQTRSSEDDWAVIELNSQIGNQTGWLGLRWQSESYNNTFVYNTGYPAVVTDYEQDTYERNMFIGTGNIISCGTKYLRGDWDATGGNSGGPVFANYSDTGYTLIGILTAGSAVGTDFNDYGVGENEAYTYATRITEDIYNLFISYRVTE